MLEAANARRRKRGEAELTEDTLHEQVREHQRESVKRRDDYMAELEVAHRVCAALRSEPVKVSDTLSLTITLSVGSAALPIDARTATALLAAADKALYAAKARGRDCAVGFAEL